jgi:hypothetical protein
VIEERNVERAKVYDLVLATRNENVIQATGVNDVNPFDL